VIHPDLMYELWKQEHSRRLRTAAHRQSMFEARLKGRPERPSKVTWSSATHNNWIALLGAGVLRLRRLWTIS
jgi:hypothetical protein